MPLTKKDLSQIKGVVHEEVGVAVKGLATKQDVENATEGLAVLVNKGFSAVQKQIELLDKRVELIEKEILHVNARLDSIEHDIAEIRRHFVYRDEFEGVIARLSVVEKKLGIKAGK